MYVTNRLLTYIIYTKNSLLCNITMSELHYDIDILHVTVLSICIYYLDITITELGRRHAVLSQ